MSDVPDLGELPVVYLTTLGRKTGRPHSIEIWFAQRGPALYMLSGGGDRSDWVRNLMKTPEVEVRSGTSVLRGIARVLTEPAEQRLARDAVYDKYSVRYAGDLTGWRESALPIAIDLDVGSGQGTAVTG